jgi:hypothetical protein
LRPLMAVFICGELAYKWGVWNGECGMNLISVELQLIPHSPFPTESPKIQSRRCKVRSTL